jgi:hypothetical protein
MSILLDGIVQACVASRRVTVLRDCTLQIIHQIHRRSQGATILEHALLIQRIVIVIFVAFRLSASNHEDVS